MAIHPDAGKPVSKDKLANIAELVSLYYETQPDVENPDQKVAFGTVVPTDGSYRLIEDYPANGYRMFMFRDGCLGGALLIGNLKLLKAVRKAIQAQLDTSALLAEKPTAEQIAAHIAAL